MAEDLKSFVINESESGKITVADSVVAICAGITATEVEGVASLSTSIPNEIISKLGVKNLSKGVAVDINGDDVYVCVSIVVSYGAKVKEVSEKVQQKVKASIENMTGLEVSTVDVRIAGVEIN